MRFRETEVSGAYVVELDLLSDDRGYFARTFCTEEFAAAGLDVRVVQRSISFNEAERTLRGLHYQAEPHGETKLVRCSRGSIWDVIVDVRPGSPSYLAWSGIRLVAGGGELLYIPEGVAHGFITLERASEVDYQMSVPYVATSARGLRWDDPALGIQWPIEPLVMSERDRSYPDLGR